MIIVGSSARSFLYLTKYVNVGKQDNYIAKVSVKFSYAKVT